MEKRTILKDIKDLWFVRTKFGESYPCLEDPIDPVDYEEIMDGDIIEMVKEVLAIEEEQLAEKQADIKDLQVFLTKYV